MNKIGKVSLALCCILSLTFAFGTYYRTKVIKNRNDNSSLQNNIGNLNSNSIENNQIKRRNIRITPNTTMTYEYHYKEDGEMITNHENPPYFLIGLTQGEVERKFIDWEVISFTQKEVILKKMLDGRSEKHYILGEKDGYIAVFYDKEINGSNLKELTNTLVSTLNETEQKRIKEGIFISGEERLIRALEDYCS